MEFTFNRQLANDSCWFCWQEFFCLKIECGFSIFSRKLNLLPAKSTKFFVGKIEGGFSMVYLLVGAAGALGAIFRYLIGISFFTEASFPFATLSINLVGSFLLAWLSTRFFVKTSLPPYVSTAIGTGFVGSFTTFSTLSVETVGMFQDGKIVPGVVYVIVSVVGGLMMARLGFAVGKEAEAS
jgi:CrcB protein